MLKKITADEFGKYADKDDFKKLSGEYCNDILISEESITMDNFTCPDDSNVFIKGDFIINGNLEDGEMTDGFMDPPRFFLINGNLKAKNIFLNSDMFITGDLIAENFIIAESDGNYRLVVEGNIKAKNIIALGHHVKVSEKITSDFKIGFLGIESDVPKDQMKNAFQDEFVNQWGGIEINQVINAVKDGKPVLK